MKKTRNEILVHAGAVILLAGIGVAVGWILLDADGEGLGFMSAAVEDRPSRHYVLKTVQSPRAADSAVVRPGGTDYENGAANIVTAVVADYRLLDTLGEVVVLFAAAAGVALLLGRRTRAIRREASIIVRTAVPVIMLFAGVTGAYVVLHGHLGPGGGFSGGAVLASAFFLRFLAESALSHEAPRARQWLPVLEGLSGLGLLVVGVVGLLTRGSFFSAVLPQGTLGSFASAGTAVVVYALIGAKVASELSSVTTEFIGE
jgi:multicomponent Na+:H+ antiporter subunit B